MSDKSHVGMGHKLCPVCHTKHDEVVLLDKRLRDTLTRDMFMGYELCPECAKKSEEYLAIIGMTGDPNTDKSAQFIGEVAHVRRAFASEIFTNVDTTRPFMFAPPEVIDMLKNLASTAE
jgi:hypothetical protein